MWENVYMAANKTKKEDDFRTQVDRCIEAYKQLLNTGMALDYCRIQGKQRTFILRDPEFIRETKAIRAEKYRNELEEVQEIYEAATRMGESDSDGYTGDDGRGAGGKSKKKGSSTDKDALAMQLRAASMRRELMSLTAEDNADNEESTLNFFFTALTAEEMEKLKEVEVNHGSGDDKALMSMGSDEDNTEDVASQAKKRNQQARAVDSINFAERIKDMSPQERDELMMALVSVEGQ